MEKGRASQSLGWLFLLAFLLLVSCFLLVYFLLRNSDELSSKFAEPFEFLANCLTLFVHKVHPK